MASDAVRGDVGPIRSALTGGPDVRRVSCWPRVVMLGAALVGLWLAQWVATSSDDPFDSGVKLATSAVVVVSLVLMGVSVPRLVTLTKSRWRNVFPGRHVLRCAIALAVITAALAVSFFVLLAPFQNLVARGHIAATDIADAGWVFAVIVCGVGAGSALVTAWDTSHEERHWGDWMGISR